MTAKNLVAFMDGTWNSPNSMTNVYRLYELASLAEKSEQDTHYVKGVGGDTYSRSPRGWYQKLRAGAFGRETAAKIRETYCFLADNYNEGDRVFLFGFMTCPQE